VYLVSRQPGCPADPECLASSVEPEHLPSKVVELIIPVRGGLPDNPTRVTRSPSVCSLMLRRIENGSLVVNAREFESWYKAERRRKRWPPQKGGEAPRRRGRPPTDNIWEGWIKAIVEKGLWSAQQPVADLLRLIERNADSLWLQAGKDAPPKKDAISQIVNRIFDETGDDRFRRQKRRSSRKIRSCAPGE
jgi:hypothetical protein